VGFTSAAFDESTSAAETGRQLGVAHHVDMVDIDLAETAIRVGESCDDPFADSSALAVYHLCRSASQHVKVALSGDGADELLAGYVTHRIAPFAPAIRAIPGPVRNALLRSASTLLPAGDHPYSAREMVRRLILAGGEREGRSHASWRRYFFPGDERLLLSEEAFQSVAAAVDPIDIYARPYLEAAATGSRLRAAMAADLTFYLPNDMLTKVDRMSMAHSLEVRVPMLEDNFVKLVRSLPDHLLYTWRGKGKRILRDSIRERMPWFDLTRPKRGFLVPLAQGFRADLAILLRDLLASRSAHESGLFNRGEVEKLLQRHEHGVVDASFQLYTCLTVLLWWRKSFG
jgi:asparagine synthase (glutamine-hydrolysing)